MRFNNLFDGKGNVIESVEIPYTQEEIAAHLANYRWQVESGGMTINGVTVQTDANSRANILGAKELGISIQWKTPDGFVTLTAEQVAGIATAVGMHIQKCFEVEAALSGQTFESIEALETAFNEAMEAT